MHKKVQTLDKSKAKKFIKELQKLVTKTLEKASTAGQQYYQGLIELRVLNLVRHNNPNLTSSEAETIIEHLKAKKIQKDVRELGETMSSKREILDALEFSRSIERTAQVDKVYNLGLQSVIEMGRDINEGVEHLAQQLIKLKDLSKQLTI
ncbi:MAG: hypothetical protein HOC64_06430 [Bacteroidetes bacterium]|nr:hypothetical protein [Bacteroidota bacterium]